MANSPVEAPGEGVHLATTAISVDYDQVFERIPTAYERLLLDALEDDHTNFAREDGVEEAWRIVSRMVDPPDHASHLSRRELGPEGLWRLAGGRSPLAPTTPRWGG